MLRLTLTTRFALRVGLDASLRYGAILSTNHFTEKSLDLASQPGDCEIDEDCVEYGKNAVCNTDTGNCACPRNMTLYGDSPPGVEQCRGNFDYGKPKGFLSHQQSF